jgi:hypothetical protein
MGTLLDEFHGVGGSYLLNPKTGKRTIIEQTLPAQPSETPTEDLTSGPDCTQNLSTFQD